MTQGIEQQRPGMRSSARTDGRARVRLGVATIMAVGVLGACAGAADASGNTVDVDKAGQSGTAAPAGRAGATSGGMLELSDLPHRDRLGAWERVDLAGPSLACVPEKVMNQLTTNPTVVGSEHRRFAAPMAGDASTAIGSVIGETVIEFKTVSAAQIGMETVASWLHDCAADDLLRPGSVGGKSITVGRGGERPEVNSDKKDRNKDRGKKNRNKKRHHGPAVGFWETFLRTASLQCADECDGVWFDRQALVRDGHRLLLVSLNELGGPLEPEGLDQAIKKVVTAAVRRA